MKQRVIDYLVDAANDIMNFINNAEYMYLPYVKNTYAYDIEVICSSEFAVKIDKQPISISYNVEDIFIENNSPYSPAMHRISIGLSICGNNISIRVRPLMSTRAERFMIWLTAYIMKNNCKFWIDYDAIRPLVEAAPVIKMCKLISETNDVDLCNIYMDWSYKVGRLYVLDTLFTFFSDGEHPELVSAILHKLNELGITGQDTQIRL